MGPQQRMNEINKIHELMNSTEAKEYKKRIGEKLLLRQVNNQLMNGVLNQEIT